MSTEEPQAVEYGTLVDALSATPIGPATAAQRLAADAVGGTGLFLIDKNGYPIKVDEAGDGRLQPVRSVYVEPPISLRGMSAAELNAARHELDVTVDWLSENLQISRRSLLRYLSGESPVPAGVADRVYDLLTEAEHHMHQGAEAVLADPSVTFLKVFRAVEEMPAAVRSWGYPPSWYARLMARTVAEVHRRSERRLRLFYIDEAPAEDAQEQ